METPPLDRETFTSVARDHGLVAALGYHPTMMAVLTVAAFFGPVLTTNAVFSGPMANFGAFISAPLFFATFIALGLRGMEASKTL